MNTREVMAEAERLAAKRGWDDSDPHFLYLLGLLGGREDARRSVKTAIARVRHELDRMDRMIAQPAPLLNDLGELQQKPAAVEAAVGQFIAADTAFRDYLANFPAQEV